MECAIRDSLGLDALEEVACSAEFRGWLIVAIWQHAQSAIVKIGRLARMTRVCRMSAVASTFIKNVEEVQQLAVNLGGDLDRFLQSNNFIDKDLVVLSQIKVALLQLLYLVLCCG